MKKFYLLAALFLAATQISAQPVIDVLPLDKNAFRVTELESIPPWPKGVVLSGANEHWQKVVHKGEKWSKVVESAGTKVRSEPGEGGAENVSRHPRATS